MQEAVQAWLGVGAYPSPPAAMLYEDTSSAGFLLLREYEQSLGAKELHGQGIRYVGAIYKVKTHVKLVFDKERIALSALSGLRSDYHRLLSGTVISRSLADLAWWGLQAVVPG